MREKETKKERVLEGERERELREWCMCVCVCVREIYIYREREKERERYIRSKLINNSFPSVCVTGYCGDPKYPGSSREENEELVRFDLVCTDARRDLSVLCGKDIVQTGGMGKWKRYVREVIIRTERTERKKERKNWREEKLNVMKDGKKEI